VNKLTLRRRNHLDQDNKLPLYRLIFDSSVSTQQSEAEIAVEEQQALDFPFLAVTVIKNVTSTPSAAAIRCNRAAPTRLTPFSYFWSC